jgi:uncharacterized protein YceH (UPF0502 family)
MDLTADQARVLGCLVEKEATTPDQYPLSTHALVTACNQKNNRDPLTSYTERDVDNVMLDLRQMGLARTVHGASARVPKHRHVLDEAWGLEAAQLAVLAVMMLRGPNTLNELRIRTERYVDWSSADDVRAAVRALEERDPPFVVELGRQSGQRETRFTHLLTGEPAMGTTTAATPSASETPARSVPATPPATPAPGLAEEVAELRTEVAALRDRFDELARRLGEEI